MNYVWAKQQGQIVDKIKINSLAQFVAKLFLVCVIFFFLRQDGHKTLLDNGQQENNNHKIYHTFDFYSGQTNDWWKKQLNFNLLVSRIYEMYDVLRRFVLFC